MHSLLLFKHSLFWNCWIFKVMAGNRFLNVTFISLSLRVRLISIAFSFSSTYFISIIFNKIFFNLEIFALSMDLHSNRLLDWGVNNAFAAGLSNQLFVGYISFKSIQRDSSEDQWQDFDHLICCVKWNKAGIYFFL